MKLGNHLDFNQYELQNGVIENLSSAPSTPFPGQIYFNTTDNLFYLFDGTNWVSLNNPIPELNTNVNVTFTGTDTYTGVGTPTITSYDTSTIYICTFENANTSTTPTIDVDGVGVLTVVKSDETGIIALEVGDIQPAVSYFLVWDGDTSIQLYTQSPTAEPGTYTNLNPVPTTIGGIPAGSTFNNTTYSQIFDTLFYPYMVPNFTSFAISGQSLTLEVGASIAAGSKTYTWGTTNPGNIQTNTIRIRNGATVILDNSPNDGSQVINLASPITKTTVASNSWDIRATRTNGSYMTRTMTVWWYWRHYYGTSINTTLTESDIEALTSSFLGTVITGNYNFIAGGYKYFAFPNTAANPVLFKDTTTNLAIAMADASDGYTDTNAGVYPFQFVSVTNTYGVTINYRVYRSKYILGSSIQINIT